MSASHFPRAVEGFVASTPMVTCKGLLFCRVGKNQRLQLRWRPRSTDGCCGRACLGSYDPALVPEAPIGLIKKDSTKV